MSNELMIRRYASRTWRKARPASRNLAKQRRQIEALGDVGRQAIDELSSMIAYSNDVGEYTSKPTDLPRRVGRPPKSAEEEQVANARVDEVYQLIVAQIVEMVATKMAYIVNDLPEEPPEHWAQRFIDWAFGPPS